MRTGVTRRMTRTTSGGRSRKESPPPGPSYFSASAIANARPGSSSTTAVPRISTYRSSSAGSHTVRLTRGSRSMLVTLRRPAAVEISTSSPSRSTHTGEVCGLPSGFTVAITTTCAASTSAARELGQDAFR